MRALIACPRSLRVLGYRAGSLVQVNPSSPLYFIGVNTTDFAKGQKRAIFNGAGGTAFKCYYFDQKAILSTPKDVVLSGTPTGSTLTCP
ncbi:MAG: hypothetical protein WDA27_10765 [Actinomycetota bacterium]